MFIFVICYQLFCEIFFARNPVTSYVGDPLNVKTKILIHVKMLVVKIIFDRTLFDKTCGPSIDDVTKFQNPELSLATPLLPLSHSLGVVYGWTLEAILPNLAFSSSRFSNWTFAVNEKNCFYNGLA